MKKLFFLVSLLLLLSGCGTSSDTGSGSYRSNPTWEPPSDTYQNQSGDLDCSDFWTQSQAQKVLNENPSDPHRLDRDGDGIACDILP